VNRRPLRRTALLAAALAALAVGASGAAGGTAKPAFTQPQYVDTVLAGGEPLIMANPLHGTLVYSSHEGTTHLYRDGLVNSPFGDFQFVANYCNQVNIWTSVDGGVTWQRDKYMDTPCPTSPAINTGFSDPDLTTDSSGRMYDTGIDLVNDALFSSGDGGKTWDEGTPQCHDGDRPWLAGGKPDEVFMATDTEENSQSHQIYQSTDGGQTCSSTGIPDAGTTSGGLSYSGFGKLYMDTTRNRLAEPEVFTDSNGNLVGVGVGTWTRGDLAFTPHFVAKTSLYSHWPALAIDSSNDVYLTWDTDNRVAGTTGGCNGGPSPAPNSVRLAVSRDFGATWSTPVTVAAPSSSRVYWPWIAAGDTGKVSVVWYQTGPNQLPDLDCQAGDTYVYEASLVNANTGKPQNLGTVNASGRVIHYGQVCQGGTTCVATGQDRRLGDYFTNALDARGCVLIASGDTMMLDPLTGAQLPTARPIFMRQNAGPALIGKGSCS
jgi:hypothetical protein